MLSGALFANIASAQKTPEKWAVKYDDKTTLFTDAIYFSQRTAYLISADGRGWDIWDTVNYARPFPLPVINSRREVISTRLTGLAFNTDTSGFICGENGVLLQTKDFGRNWKQRYFPDMDSMSFYGVAFASPLKGALVGVRAGMNRRMQGVILRTTDGGDTWKRMDSISGIGFSHITAEHFSGALVIVGLGSTLSSQDQGATWKTTLTPDSVLLRSAGILGESAMAVGASGKVLVSSDFGGTWKTGTSPTKSDLLGVEARTDLEWYVCGVNGEVWTTADFGETWKDWRAPTKAALTGMSLQGNLLFAWGDQGKILVRDISK